ncbi:MAG: Ppx/GppA family phosphatase [Campylobacteraceae bacterium]|nr:Ppx/GppA family phosphatase [Campylobacteraceae bacterium]
MPKRTAVIDIGSNSARVAIYEKSSRFAFHLINETKSRIRIGEGAYNFGGVLQENAINRALIAMEEFSHIIKGFKCSKVLCIATSALRDAPNASIFVKKVRQKLGINVKIIDGNAEAYYGAIGAINYLEGIGEAVTIDIGGGSTELAKIKNGFTEQTISLNLGTVRLKELFFDKKIPLDQIRAFLTKEIEKIPEDFACETMIGIGGTLRSLAKMLIEKSNYPLKTVHGFEYEISSFSTSLIDSIVTSDVLGLKTLGVRKDRYDTMREGCIIFQSIFEKLSVKRVVTSGAGIREGVYLCDLLRSNHHKFNPDFKLSLKSLKDRFSLSEDHNAYIKQLSYRLFDLLSPLHNIPPVYKHELGVAAELYNIGVKLGFYQNNLHSFYFIINNLNYGFTHKQKMLIAMLVKYHVNKLPSQEDLNMYKMLLPEQQTIEWLSFLLSLAKALSCDTSKNKLTLDYHNYILTVHSDKKLSLAREQVKQLIKPASFAIIIK